MRKSLLFNLLIFIAASSMLVTIVLGHAGNTQVGVNRYNPNLRFIVLDATDPDGIANQHTYDAGGNEISFIVWYPACPQSVTWGINNIFPTSFPLKVVIKDCQDPPSVETFIIHDPSSQNASAVGGIVVPVDKFGLLAPYIGLASTILVATVATTIYVKHVKRRKEE